MIVRAPLQIQTDIATLQHAKTCRLWHKGRKRIKEEKCKRNVGNTRKFYSDQQYI